MSDLNRALYDYSRDLEFDEGELSQIERRLDILHNLQVKYGETYKEMMEALEERKERRRKRS